IKKHYLLLGKCLDYPCDCRQFLLRFSTDYSQSVIYIDNRLPYRKASPVSRLTEDDVPDYFRNALTGMSSSGPPSTVPYNEI
ncbi:TPA: hypothetical protein ACIV34_004580, partial [Salmonella enterica subsp. enterica serovar Java]